MMKLQSNFIILIKRLGCLIEKLHFSINNPSIFINKNNLDSIFKIL